MPLTERKMDRDVRISLVCGGIVALSGFLGYIVLPLATGEFTDLTRIVTSAMSKSLGYHMLILTMPSWLVTFGGIVWARQWGLDSTWDDVVIVGGINGVPLLMAFATYVIAAVGMALVITFSGPIETPLVVIAAMGLVLLALLVGFAFAAIVFVIVFLAVGVGSIAGYTSARAVLYLWGSVRQ